MPPTNTKTIAYVLAREDWPGPTHAVELGDVGPYAYSACGATNQLHHLGNVIDTVEEFDRLVRAPARCQKCRAILRGAST